MIAAVLTRGGQENAYGTPRRSLATGLDLMMASLDTDIRILTGQRRAPRGFITQIASNASVAFDEPMSAAALMAAERGRWCVAGPEYWAEADDASGATAGTGGHLSSFGYECLGLMEGRAILDELFGSGQRPLRIDETQIYWRDTSASPKLEIGYDRAVMIDTSGEWVNPAGLAAAGFDLTDDFAATAITAVVPVALAATAAIAGNQITFGGPGPAVATTLFTAMDGGNAPAAVVAIVDGVPYGIEWSQCDLQYDVIVARLAALIPAASASGLVLTCAAGAVIASVTFYSNRLLLTLAAKPGAGAWRLHYAQKSTGTAIGGQTGARGLARSPVAFTSIVNSGGITKRLSRWALRQTIANISRY